MSVESLRKKILNNNSKKGKDMSFGPSVDTIVLKLLESGYSEQQLQEANSKGIDIKDVALIELSLWVHYGEAIGQLVIEDDCIVEGRVRYFSSIVNFLGSRSDIPNALLRSQICTTKAAAKAAEICADAQCTEITVAHYKEGCDATFRSVQAVMQRLEESERKLNVRVPLCEDPIRLSLQE